MRESCFVLENEVMRMRCAYILPCPVLLVVVSSAEAPLLCRHMAKEETFAAVQGTPARSRQSLQWHACSCSRSLPLQMSAGVKVYHNYNIIKPDWLRACADAGKVTRV